jgi:hypothetical protein
MSARAKSMILPPAASSPFVKFMPGKFPCAAGSRWAITNLQPKGMPGRDRESQPFRPSSLFQFPNPHPVDPPLDNDLGMFAIAEDPCAHFP